MASIYVTRAIPEVGIEKLKEAGHEVVVSEKDGVLTKEELISALKEKEYDAVLPLLTDTIDGNIFDAVPSAKIFANYAVGFNNVDLDAAKEKGVTITNTPGVLTDTVAEYTVSLMLSIMHRISEAERFTRAELYKGWAPMMFLGSDLKGKTLGILGAGRIGQRVAEICSVGFGAEIAYYDIKRNEDFENSVGATFYDTPEELLKIADVVSVHVPLLDSTHHLLNQERMQLMKSSAYLINTSRGPVVDEKALIVALEEGTIRGAAIDVLECEPLIDCDPTDALELAKLENVIITPHIASATEETRGKMAEMAAQNIIDFLEGKTPENVVQAK